MKSKRGWILLYLMLCFSQVFSLDPNMIRELEKKDQTAMKVSGITLQEQFSEMALDWSRPKEELFELGKRSLNENRDVINAYRIFNYLAVNFNQPQYYLYLGQCYYFMAEMYYEGYAEKYYAKAYEVFTRLRKRDKKNIELLKWNSYAAAKLGGFIKSKEQGTFSGLSYLRESVSLNDDLLDLDSKNEDGLLTEAEYQIETDSVPFFGGSEKKGVQIMQGVLKKNPQNMRANLLMGKYLYGKKKDPARAIPYLLKAAELYDSKTAPQDMLHYYMRIFVEMHLVRCYGRLQNTEKYFEHLSKHLAMLPRSPSGLSALADYLGNTRKDFAAACTVSKRLLEISPFGNKQALVNQYCRSR